MLQLFPLLYCFLWHVFTYGLSITCSPFLILHTGDVEINPGPRHNSGDSFSICDWNLNSVSAYNYTKLSSLKAFLAVLNSTLSVSQKHICILAMHHLMIIWKSQAIAEFDSTFLLAITVDQFVYTIKIFCHCEFLISNAYMYA